MDVLGLQFRYSNMLAQSIPDTARRRALADIVRWLQEGKRDEDCLRIAIKNATACSVALMPQPDENPETALYAAELKQVYDEFLTYASSVSPLNSK